MFNYPPGVTGREPEIAGYPEGNLFVTCDTEVDLFVIPFDVMQDLQLAASTAEKLRDDCNEWKKNNEAGKPQNRTKEQIYQGLMTNNWRVSNLMRNLETYRPEERKVAATCPFEGEVEAVFTRDAAIWTCPVCGTEKEEPAPEPDYEAIQEAKMEAMIERQERYI